MAPATSITIISSPYHVGLKDHRVGTGPKRILSLGLESQLSSLGIPTSLVEIPPVDDFEGEIGRSFEVLRRISTAVSSAASHGSFPLVVAGNCMSTVAIAAGLNDSLQGKEPGFVYLDAHDDFETPDTLTNGYLDATGLSMLAGQSFKALMATLPGFVAPLKLDKFVFCGLRDLSDGMRQKVEKNGMSVVWGGDDAPSSFAAKLKQILEQKKTSLGQHPTLMHLDLDVLDQSVGKVNGYESGGGILEKDLLECMEVVPGKVEPVSLTVCSFNAEQGDGSDGDKVAQIGVGAIIKFVRGLLENGHLRLK